MNVREWALPVYTILMQLAVGSLLVLWLIRTFSARKFSYAEIDRISRRPMLVIVFTMLVAMFGSHFHLSRPLYSFLAILNFKTSWLSREIVFSVSFFTTTLFLSYLIFFQPQRYVLITRIGYLGVALGLALIFCMAHIYVIPTQVAWNSPTVIFSFYTTMLLLGSMSITCLMVLDLKFAEIEKSDDVDTRAEIIRDAFTGVTLATIVLVLGSILIVAIQMRFLSQGDQIARTSLDLLLQLYLPLLIERFALLLFSSGYLGFALYRLKHHKITPQDLMMPVYLSCLFIMIGEIVGRFLFYATHIRVGV